MTSIVRFSDAILTGIIDKAMRRVTEHYKELDYDARRVVPLPERLVTFLQHDCPDEGHGRGRMMIARTHDLAGMVEIDYDFGPEGFKLRVTWLKEDDEDSDTFEGCYFSDISQAISDIDRATAPAYAWGLGPVFKKLTGGQ